MGAKCNEQSVPSSAIITAEESRGRLKGSQREENFALLKETAMRHSIPGIYASLRRQIDQKFTD